MRDRIAIHKLVDRVLDELDEGKNFINLEIGTYCISVDGKHGDYTPEKPYAVNVSIATNSPFTMDDANDLIRRIDAIADANPHD